MCRADALDLGLFDDVGQKFNRRSSGVWPSASWSCTFEDRSNTPWLLPINFLEIRTEPMVTKLLLSLVVQLDLQVHLFRIRAAYISHGSNSALRSLQ